MSAIATQYVTRQGLAPLPLLAPGTYSARQVLNFVIRVIEEEPARLFMGNWQSALLNKVRAQWYADAYNQNRNAPACGTVCCVAGWICTVTQPTAVDNSTHGTLQGVGRGAALDILRLDTGQTDTRAEAGKELEAIFYRTDEDETTIVPALRAFVAKYRALLSHIKVVVR